MYCIFPNTMCRRPYGFIAHDAVPTLRLVRRRTRITLPRLFTVPGNATAGAHLGVALRSEQLPGAKVIKRENTVQSPVAFLASYAHRHSIAPADFHKA